MKFIRMNYFLVFKTILLHYLFRNSLRFPTDSCKHYSPVPILLRLQDVYLLSGIFLHQDILEAGPLISLIHNLHYIIFCDNLRKNAYYPNRTIKLLNNRIYI